MEYYVNDKRREIQKRKLQQAQERLGRRLAWSAKLSTFKEIGLVILFTLGIVSVAMLITEFGIRLTGG